MDDCLCDRPTPMNHAMLICQDKSLAGVGKVDVDIPDTKEENGQGDVTV